MAQFSTEEVQTLIEKTDWDTGKFSITEQPHIARIGTCWPQNANWAYELGIIARNGVTYLIATKHSQIVGYKPLYF